MSFRCAVAMIQAPGFSGTPLSGQEASAEANASCIASSARSKEPETRIKLAMIRPDSCRKTDSAADRISTIQRSSLIGRHLGFRARRQAGQGANFDAAFASLAGGRNLLRPLDGFVQVLAIEDVIASQLFLGLGEGSVCDQRFTVLHSNGGRVSGGAQRLGPL